MSNSSDSLMINTPASIRQCEVVNILWSGGVGEFSPAPTAPQTKLARITLRSEPYYVGYIAAGTVGVSSDQ